MFASIIEAILAFLKAIPIFQKYFPPTSTEQKVQEGQNTIDDEIKKINETGRP